MNYGYIQISNLQLVFSVSLVVLTGIVSALLQLGLLKSLLWGTVRAFAQLTLIGYILTYVFKWNHPAVIFSLILVMCWIASREAIGRIKNAPANPMRVTYLSMIASTFIVGLIVVVVIIGPEPWYSARVMIPIFGMLLGNSMNAIALSLDRMLSDVTAHADEVEQMLCFGATPWEAVVIHVKKAVSSGMTPTLNSLAVVGIVSLPGMMTGQILAGMDPQSAVRYQFVVMIMIAAAVAIGCLMMVGLSYKTMFTADGALVESMRKN
ncbi:MAG: ABC transporter permease [Solirubrobacterales bacterium]